MDQRVGELADQLQAADHFIRRLGNQLQAANQENSYLAAQVEQLKSGVIRMVNYIRDHPEEITGKSRVRVVDIDQQEQIDQLTQERDQLRERLHAAGLD